MNSRVLVFCQHDILILRADKRNTTVVMASNPYNNKIMKLI